MVSGYRMKVLTVAMAALIASVLVASSTARADIIGVLVEVEATSQMGTAKANLNIPTLPDPVPEKVQWKLASKLQLRDAGNNLIAELEDLTIGYEQDPAIDLGFQVTAGNSDTTFTISSAVLAFPAITNGIAFASAAVTLTDGAALPGNGADLNVVAPATGLYKATYNGATTFAELLGNVNLPGAGSIGASTDSGIQIIPASVTSMDAQFKFKLSANDLASGTSRFEIVIPEPATGTLLGLAGFALLRRRRHA